MRIEDFPRPKDDNRRGIHWSASVYHPSGAALDFWIDELNALHVKWVKLLDDGGGSSVELCERLLAADMMPIVRLYRLEPNPGTIGSREEDAIRRLVAAGVRYFETNNEPDATVEWKKGQRPSDWLEVIVRNFIVDADKVLGLGGLPAFPAFGRTGAISPASLVKQTGRGDLFESGSWIAVHNYTLNHPLDYPYDSVNQLGTAVSQEEYDRRGPWAWDGRTRESIDSWRAADKHPGATLATDAAGFLAYRRADELAFEALGYRVPIISTEGGPIVGCEDDRRYPRIDAETHFQWLTAAYDFMQGKRDIGGASCPSNYLAFCPWLMANYRLGHIAPGSESHSWYSDWWNAEFKLKGALPVVAAVKAMGSFPVDRVYQAIVAGTLQRADTGDAVPNVPVELWEGNRLVARATAGPDGSFRMERLRPGTYDLKAAPWGLLQSDVQAGYEPVSPLLVRLGSGDNSVLSGRLIDHAGTPRAGVRATLRQNGALVQETVSGTDGAFRFASLPMGVYWLAVPGITVAGISLDGWTSKNVRLVIGVPANCRYAVSERRPLPEGDGKRGIFCGRVYDHLGLPRSGVRVQMSWTGSAPDTRFPVVISGASLGQPAGYYEFVHTAGQFRIQVVEGDWPSDIAEGQDAASPAGRDEQPVSYQVDFRLKTVASPAQIDGLVSGGKAGGLLRLHGPAGAWETRLGEQGQFSFTNLPAGVYRLVMADTGTLLEDLTLESGDLFKFLFPLRSRLRGQVLGAPAGSEAVLHAPVAWGWSRQAFLDQEGRFSFEALPPGQYRLAVAGRNVEGLVLTGENTHFAPTIDLMEGRRGQLRGQVADYTGRPQPDVLITLRSSGQAVAQTRTTGDGYYRFASLVAGSYELDAEGMGQVAEDLALDGRREQVQDIVWGSRGPQAVLQGRVLAANGLHQSGLTVRLLRDGNETAKAETDSGGIFRFSRLEAGVYALAVGESEPLVSGIVTDDISSLVQDVILLPGGGKLMAHYVLFGLLPDTATPAGSTDQSQTASDSGVSPSVMAEARLALGLTWSYICRAGATGGFSLADATEAAQVTIVGDQIPVAAEETLRTAGCQITRLPGSGFELADALQRLLDTAGEG